MEPMWCERSTWSMRRGVGVDGIRQDLLQINQALLSADEVLASLYRMPSMRYTNQASTIDDACRNAQTLCDYVSSIVDEIDQLDQTLSHGMQGPADAISAIQWEDITTPNTVGWAGTDGPIERISLDGMVRYLGGGSVAAEAGTVAEASSEGASGDSGFHPYQVNWFGKYDKASMDTDLGMTGNYARYYVNGPADGSRDLTVADGEYSPMYSKSGILLGYTPTLWFKQKTSLESEVQTGGNPLKPAPAYNTVITLADFGRVERTIPVFGITASDSVSGVLTTSDPDVYGQGSASYWLGLHAEGSGGAQIKDWQATAAVSGMVGLGAHGEAQGSINYHGVEAKGSAEATAGAWASGDASVGIGIEGIKAKVSAEAMAGASASAHASAGVEGVQVGVGATAYAGVGIKANVSASLSMDKVELNVDVGAALGVGFGVKFDININPKEIVNNIKNLWPFGGNK